MFTITAFQKKKNNQNAISMVTSYDYPTAKMVNESLVDAILVGDSVAMVMHGFENTTYATREMMTLHTAAVKRGAPDKLIVTDMPFLSLQRGEAYLFETLDQFIKAGAQAVKVEGGLEVYTYIEQIIASGIPVMGHLGLTPQAVNLLGGYKVQGREEAGAQSIFEQALKLEALGVFSIVLECVPPGLAQKISKALKIPVIGIGAGSFVDGQILVIDDLLGKSNTAYPKFVRQYLNTYEQSVAVLNHYHQDIENGLFPNDQESYQ